MPRPSSSYQRLTGGCLITCLLALVIAAATSSATAAPSAGQLQQQIGTSQSQVSSLSGQVDAANGKIHALNGTISGLEQQIATAQSAFDAKRAVLLQLRTETEAAQTRLSQLQAYERTAQSTLAQQLVGTYEGGAPDAVSVVVDSSGFNNLLEQLSFAERIGRQDAKVVAQVRASRRAVAAQATTLAALGVRQQKATVQALNVRNQLANAKLALVKQELTIASTRDAALQRLRGARNRVASLGRQLNQLEAPVTGSGGASLPVGGFTFPMPKGDASPPVTWSPDDGVDIAAPGGTPEFAVCSGAIVLHGIGGFGPSAPVLHCDSPLDGFSYVYYGHAGPGNWVPVGTHVHQGEVISEVGSGIVGISTGPHLEIGFADSSGSPIGPSSAGTMMSLLRASY